MKMDEKTIKKNGSIIKIIICVCLLLVICGIIVFIINKTNMLNQSLTINQVKQIAQKGDEVSWADFKDYKGKEIGSGLRIIYYEIEGEYDLMIGGTSEDEKPMYVRLVLDGNTDKYIDIRTENIDEFINSTK